MNLRRTPATSVGDAGSTPVTGSSVRLDGLQFFDRLFLGRMMNAVEVRRKDVVEGPKGAAVVVPYSP